MINFQEELEKAKNGDGLAAYLVSECYAHGYFGVEKHGGKALKWIKKGAKMPNNALCLFDMAFINRANRKKAKKFFDLSYDKIVAMADGGERCAYFLLGLYHSRGFMGNPVDFNKAFELYEKAAMQGFPTAQYNVGYYYYEGKGVQMNLHKALEWFDKAIAAGCQESREYRQEVMEDLRAGGGNINQQPQQSQEIKQLKCTSCHSPIQIRGGKGFCEYCNSVFALN